MQKHEFTNAIKIDVTSKLADALQGNSSFLSTLAPYAIGLGSVIVSIVVGIVTYKTAKKSIDNQKEIAESSRKLEQEKAERSRYVDTISMERSKWIANVREGFSEFNQKCHEFALKFATLAGDKMTDVDKKEMYNIVSELRLISYKVILYLNPIEKPTMATQKIMDDFINYLIECFSDKKTIESGEFNKLLKQLLYLQNVILKSEWRRLKKEVKEGELDSQDMESIFKEVAEKIDITLYDELIKVDENNLTDEK